jgi:hypothetical protein
MLTTRAPTLTKKTRLAGGFESRWGYQILSFEPGPTNVGLGYRLLDAGGGSRRAGAVAASMV